MVIKYFVCLFVSVSLSLSLTQSLVLAAPRSFRFVPLAALYLKTLFPSAGPHSSKERIPNRVCGALVLQTVHSELSERLLLIWAHLELFLRQERVC